MKYAPGFFAVMLCLVFAGSAASQSAEDIRLPANPWMADMENFRGKIFTKDLGPPSKPDEPIILSGDCSDYIDLTGMPLPISVSGSTAGKTNNYGSFSQQPECWDFAWYPASCAGRDVTYKWTAPADGEYTISITESSYDNCLQLYRFTCPDEPIYPDDYICGDDDAFVQECLGAELGYVHLSQDEEIMIVVDGYGNNSGSFQLKIYDTHISNPSDLDGFIEMQMAAFHVPGVAACAVKDGQVDWTGHYGYANIADNIEVADTTLFMLASISKVVTGAAVMQLWEDSLFALDDSINGYLPFSVRNPSHPIAPITFRMLMTHTSSINDYWPTLDALRTWGQDPAIPLDFFMEEYLTPGGLYWNAGNFNSWTPGQAFDYSNVGAALTAYLLEVISPSYDSFAQYCNDSLFTPLGMDKTSWYLADLDTINLAMPYSWNGSSYVPYGHYSDAWFPSAYLRSSTQELSRFLIAFMQHGQIDGVRILDSTTVDLMTTVQWPSGPPSGFPWGLYWFNPPAGTHSLWGHDGYFFGVRTVMVFCPQENTGVIVLTNGESSYVWYTILDHLLYYEDGPLGFVMGVVSDQSTQEVENAFVRLGGFSRWDYSDADGEYAIGGISNGTYDIIFTRAGYSDTTVQDVSVALGETTYVDMIMHSACDYVVGDVNGSNNYNGLDITYGVAFFKGGPVPTYECECGQTGTWYVAGDVNGSCSYNGLDITYGVAYFKGGDAPIPCPSCPPN